MKNIPGGQLHEDQEDQSESWTGMVSFMLLIGPLWAAENTTPVSSLVMPLTQEGGTARAMFHGVRGGRHAAGVRVMLWNPAGLGVMGGLHGTGTAPQQRLGDSNHETAVSPRHGFSGRLCRFTGYVDNGSFEAVTASGTRPTTIPPATWA